MQKYHTFILEMAIYYCRDAHPISAALIRRLSDEQINELVDQLCSMISIAYPTVNIDYERIQIRMRLSQVRPNRVKYDIEPLLDEGGQVADLDQSTECAICYGSLVELEIMQYNCNHTFCLNCIDNYFDTLTHNKKPCCALCREDIKTVKASSRETVEKFRRIRCLADAITIIGPLENEVTIVPIEDEVTIEPIEPRPNRFIAAWNAILRYVTFRPLFSA